MPKTVLIVEDETYLAGLLQDILETAGYQAVFSPASRAVDRAMDVRPDLIVMDYLMPGMTGREVAAELRKHFLTDLPPIVLVTGLPNARELAEEMGARGYLLKPFDLDDFLQIVSNSLVGEEA